MLKEDKKKQIIVSVVCFSIIDKSCFLIEEEKAKCQEETVKINHEYR